MKNDRKLMLLGLIAALVGAGYVFWTRTPGYSLARIASSVEAHDVQAFEKHVDLETLLERAFDDVLSVAMEDAAPEEGDGDEFAALGVAMISGFAEVMKPKVVEVLESAVIRYVETGALRDDAQKSEEDDVLRGVMAQAPDLSALALTFSDVEIVKEGAVSTVSLPIYYKHIDETIVLEVALRSMGSYWRVAEVSNLKAVAREVLGAQEEILSGANDEIRKSLDASIEMLGAEKHSLGSDWRRSSRVDLSIAAVDPEALTECQGALEISDATTGRSLKTLEYSLPLEGEALCLAKGASRSLSWSVDVNMFIEDTQRLWEAEASDLSVEHTVERVCTVSGCIQLFESFGDYVSAAGAFDAS